MKARPWKDRDWAAVASTIFQPIYRRSDGFAQIQQERVVPLSAKKPISGRPTKQFCAKGHDKHLPHGSYIVVNQIVKNGKTYGVVAIRCAVCRREAARVRE